jgi:hypothetical protein
MQTFLPYPSFYKSAKVLDYKRLGKQRVEAKQIYDTLTIDWRNPKRGWRNHPAVLMWKGHEEALKLYMCVMIEEWIRRGYKNTMERPIVHIAHCNNPWWVGNYDFHIAHQSNLVRKNPDYYIPIFGNIPEMPYFWPQGHSKNETY